MKTFNSLIFLVINFVVIALVYYLIPHILVELMSLSNFWLIILIVLFGGALVGIFHFFPIGLMWLTSKLSVNKSFSFYSVLILSFTLAILRIIAYWMVLDISEYSFDLFLLIMLSFLTLGFASSFSMGSGIELEKNEKLFFYISFIGPILFYIGVFMVFCMLSTKIANVNPSKEYSWYAGIWHGLFAIPKWVVSWFTEGIYFKSSNSGSAYNIFWWITFILVLLGAFGGGNSQRNNNRNY
jgi:hypothetical protein